MKKISLLVLLLWVLLAQATVPSVNRCPDMVFKDSNENTSVSSTGGGGAFPGVFQFTINGDNTYHYYVPTSYDPLEPMPLMVLWHGAAGPGNANAAAQQMRNYWAATAETHGFIVAAQASTGLNGGWLPVEDSGRLIDIFIDLETRYNIESTRRYVWGFSAGGHVMHAIALNVSEYFAAYAISAGYLDAFANLNGYTPGNATRTIPVFLSVGNTDPFLPNMQSDRTTFLNAGWSENGNFWLDVFNGGHQLPADLPQKAWEKICHFTNLD
ncbi:hypothetical protein [Marinicella meishanensis]|uniref:hypothetical protein n=1 Tax=Marinicella meishanensis TaxID=2873263 RepID=UPI001CBA8635|nr:hypothetical protein [Marinicella sp. NBU2979]